MNTRRGDMSEQTRSETRSSCNNSTVHETTSVSENQKILLYMDNVYNRITRLPNTKVIIVSKNAKFLKTNMLPDNAKFSYANISIFADKIKIVMSKLFKDDPVQSIRLKGSKHGEIFMTFDEHVEIIVFDKKFGR